MVFLGIDSFGDQREKTGYDRSTGMTYNNLAYEATDYQTSSGPYGDATKAFLSRCSYTAYEIRGDFSDNERDLIYEQASNCVPSGNYDRWLIFTELMGFEQDDYYDALDGNADLDDPSAIAAYVLNGMAVRLIEHLIQREDETP